MPKYGPAFTFIFIGLITAEAAAKCPKGSEFAWASIVLPDAKQFESDTFQIPLNAYEMYSAEEIKNLPNKEKGFGYRWRKDPASGKTYLERNDEYGKEFFAGGIEYSACKAWKKDSFLKLNCGPSIAELLYFKGKFLFISLAEYQNPSIKMFLIKGSKDFLTTVQEKAAVVTSLLISKPAWKAEECSRISQPLD